MKRYLSKTLAIIILILGIFTYFSENVFALDDNKTKGNAPQIGYLENILLDKLQNKERITLIVSQQPVINVGSQTDGVLLIRLENMFVPESLRHAFSENKLNNITQVIPSQQVIDGQQWAYLSIDIKQTVPYSIIQEGKNVFIDFKVANVVENKEVATSNERERKTKTTIDIGETGIRPVKKEVTKRYTDRAISLDFQDADIKSVLRLMAEYGNTSIVSGDDVKGNVTLTMKNVPWEQALDTILDINGLAKKQMGDVISVMTLERKKKDENDRVRAEEDQQKAEDQRKAREQKVLVEKGKLRQIMIEAKIVEATEDFVRNLGVQWGFMNNQSVGSYGLGISGGSNSLQTRGQSQVYPSLIPWTDSSTAKPLSMAAVNFPAAIASPTIGLVFGGAAGFLETQLAALESNTTGKIISAPKVVTMDNVKAVIKQGDEVPYVTPASGTSPATITFKEALLKLEVKPKITDEGRISMEIKASNDVPNYGLAATLQGNPPIRKNEIESTVVIQDGDTVVIGGILKTQDDKVVSGLPWLQKIPVLGWLFKFENEERQKRQLLIFITPKILKSEGFSESAEKIIN